METPGLARGFFISSRTVEAPRGTGDPRRVLGWLRTRGASGAAVRSLPVCSRATAYALRKGWLGGRSTLRLLREIGRPYGQYHAEPLREDVRHGDHRPAGSQPSTWARAPARALRPDSAKTPQLPADSSRTSCRHDPRSHRTGSSCDRHADLADRTPTLRNTTLLAEPGVCRPQLVGTLGSRSWVGVSTPAQVRRPSGSMRTAAGTHPRLPQPPRPRVGRPATGVTAPRRLARRAMLRS